jgi:PKD repeat protein
MQNSFMFENPPHTAMSTVLPLLFTAIIIISFTACAQEVAYAYGDLGGRPLESGNITEYNGTDIVTSSIASGSYDGRTASRGSGISVEEITREIDLKLNVGNSRVRDEGRSLILEYPGDGTINQICSIYEHMVGNWSYARDTRGIEEFQYSNQSLEYGRGKYSGQGDCDDFSILMASLIESIGGTSRIVLAYGPNGGHAYTEVYMGKAGGPESDVVRMIGWLKKKYKVNEINIHTNLTTGDVWLNLDWWKEPGGAKHPGGPFYKAAKPILIYIKADEDKTLLTPVENLLPRPLFNYSPIHAEVGKVMSFDASGSIDPDGKIVDYEWDFGDGDTSHKSISQHSYSSAGEFQVNLTVTDNEGDKDKKTSMIDVKEPLPLQQYYGPVLYWDFAKDFDGWEKTGTIAPWMTWENATKWYTSWGNATGVIVMDACDQKLTYLDVSSGIKKSLTLPAYVTKLTVSLVKADHDGGFKVIIENSSGTYLLDQGILYSGDNKKFSCDISQWAGKNVTLGVFAVGDGSASIVGPPPKTSCEPTCCNEFIGVDSIAISI